MGLDISTSTTKVIKCLVKIDQQISRFLGFLYKISYKNGHFSELRIDSRQFDRHNDRHLNVDMKGFIEGVYLVYLTFIPFIYLKKKIIKSSKYI